MDQGTIERLVIAAVGLLIALMSIAPSFLKAKAAEATSQSEKEELEVDNMKFVLRTASQVLDQSTVIVNIQKELAAALQRENMKDAEIVRLKSELDKAQSKIDELQDQLQNCYETIRGS